MAKSEKVAKIKATLKENNAIKVTEMGSFNDRIKLIAECTLLLLNSVNKPLDEYFSYLSSLQQAHDLVKKIEKQEEDAK